MWCIFYVCVMCVRGRSNMTVRGMLYAVRGHTGVNKGRCLSMCVCVVCVCDVTRRERRRALAAL